MEQQNVFEFSTNYFEKNTLQFYRKNFKKYLECLENYLLKEFKDWFQELLVQKYDKNYVPKDELYKQLIINIGEQNIESKFNLEKHQQLINLIIHLKVVYVQIDF